MKKVAWVESGNYPETYMVGFNDGDIKFVDRFDFMSMGIYGGTMEENMQEYLDEHYGNC